MHYKTTEPIQYEKAWVDERNHNVSFHDMCGYEMHFFETHDEMIRFVHHLVIRGYGLL